MTTKGVSRIGLGVWVATLVAAFVLGLVWDENLIFSAYIAGSLLTQLAYRL